MIDQVLYEGVSWALTNAQLTENNFIDNGLQEGQYRSFSKYDQVELLKQAYVLIQSAEKQVSK